jgi:hypothetical protein
MAYSKAKLRRMVIKHLSVSDHSKLEMHQTDFYLCGLYFTSYLNIVLINLTIFIGISNSPSLLKIYKNLLN